MHKVNKTSWKLINQLNEYENLLPVNELVMCAETLETVLFVHLFVSISLIGRLMQRLQQFSGSLF